MHSTIPFVMGAEYVRDELLEFVGSNQAQSGVIGGKNEPNWLICTSGGRHGKKAGYSDEPLADGTWWYFGQGQKGDQHLKNPANKMLSSGEFSILLFCSREPRAYEIKSNKSYGKFYKYIGQFLVASFEPIVPKSGSRRGNRLLRFRLAPTGLTIRLEKSDQVPLLELREEFATYDVKTASSSFTLVEYRRRSEKIQKYALNRAENICEACGLPAPFLTDVGEGFLEVHHIHRLADDGPDIPLNVIALCPNCHRRAHHSADREHFKTMLILRVLKLEAELDGRKSHNTTQVNQKIAN